MPAEFPALLLFFYTVALPWHAGNGVGSGMRQIDPRSRQTGIQCSIPTSSFDCPPHHQLTHLRSMEQERHGGRNDAA